MTQDNQTNHSEIDRSHHTVVVATPVSNGLGTSGFVFGLLSIFFWWVMFLGWILSILGACLSGAGLSKKPKGLAIAGLVLSIISLALKLILPTIFGGIFGVVSGGVSDFVHRGGLSGLH